MKILIAGIGNIFQGDDAFGCEIIRCLTSSTLPPEVTIMDFGIRSYDLAYALNGEYEAVILVDAISRNQPPGTVCLIEPETGRAGELESAAVDAHAMNPVSVIRMAESMGGVHGKMYLVGCEPAVLESDDGEIGLSEQVREAVPRTLALIQSLITDLLQQQKTTNASLEPA